jgi:ferredoxin
LLKTSFFSWRIGMADTIGEIASQCDLFLCVECGKCVAACPMTEIFKDFSYEVSPRGMIEKTLMDFNVLTSAPRYVRLASGIGISSRGCGNWPFEMASPSMVSSVSVVADSFYPGTPLNTSVSS